MRWCFGNLPGTRDSDKLAAVPAYALDRRPATKTVTMKPMKDTAFEDAALEVEVAEALAEAVDEAVDAAEVMVVMVVIEDVWLGMVLLEEPVSMNTWGA